MLMLDQFIKNGQDRKWQTDDTRCWRDEIFLQNCGEWLKIKNITFMKQ